MIGILLILDIICYLVTPLKTFFILFAFVFIDKKDWFHVLIVGLLIDLIIAESGPLVTTFLLFLFFINKYIFKLKKVDLANYLLISIFNIFAFVSTFYIYFYGFNFFSYSLFILKIIPLNFVLLLLSYNLGISFIKYSR